MSHENASLRICRYLKGTIEEGSLYLSDKYNLSLNCFVDYDFCGLWNIEDTHDPISAKSRIGYVILLAYCPILWVSKIQSFVALSTLESEYVSLSCSLRYIIPLFSLMKEIYSYFHFDKKSYCNTHSTVYEDNNGALLLSTVQKLISRTKHINVIYHCFHSYVGSVLRIIKVDNKEQKGDICTKALDETTFRNIRLLLCGWYFGQKVVSQESM